MTIKRRALSRAMVVAVIVGLILGVPASAQEAYITIWKEVDPGDTYPALDGWYHVAPGTISAINGGKVLIVGDYIKVPVKSTGTPRERRPPTNYYAYPGYSPGYMHKIWR